MFLGDPLGGFTACQAFELGRLNKEFQGFAWLQFLGPEMAESFDRLVLQH